MRNVHFQLPSMAQKRCMLKLPSYHELSKLHVIGRSSDWFIALFALVVIGRSDYFGVGFSTVI